MTPWPWSTGRFFYPTTLQHGYQVVLVGLPKKQNIFYFLNWCDIPIYAYHDLGRDTPERGVLGCAGQRPGESQFFLGEHAERFSQPSADQWSTEMEQLIGMYTVLHLVLCLKKTCFFLNVWAVVIILHHWIFTILSSQGDEIDSLNDQWLFLVWSSDLSPYKTNSVASRWPIAVLPASLYKIDADGVNQPDYPTSMHGNCQIVQPYVGRNQNSGLCIYGSWSSFLVDLISLSYFPPKILVINQYILVLWNWNFR